MSEEIVSVFRMENEDGRGCYGIKGWSCPAQELSGAHPGPWDDSLLTSNGWGHPYTGRKWHDEGYFCFDSIAQFRRWFYNDRWLIEAKENGVFLSEYKVKKCDMICGITQCVFIRENATLVTRHDCVDI